MTTADEHLEALDAGGREIADGHPGDDGLGWLEVLCGVVLLLFAGAWWWVKVAG